MRVGFTYDLRNDYRAAGYTELETAEFDRPATIDAITAEIAALGHGVERIGNVHQLAARVLEGDRWDLVFNICEGMRGFGREALVPALLDAYRIPYTFSDPMVCALTLHKAMAKRVIRDHRLPTPDFVLVESPADIAGVRLRPPVIAKPVAEGTSKGITSCSVIRSAALLHQVCLGLLEDYGQPVLLERFLPGREFTTGIVGSGAAARAVGTIEVLLRPGADADIYSYRNKEHCEELVQYRLLEEAPLRAAVEQLAVSSWRALGCRDAGRVDIRCDAGGKPQFLEANPLAGLHPEHSDLPIICTLRQIPYRDLLRWIIASAAERIPERDSERISSAA